MSVKDRPKLSRGLQDVSRIYLGGTSPQEPVDTGTCRKAAFERSICVCHPGAPLIQSAFIANLALECARHRCPVVVRDHALSEETRLSTLMDSILILDDAHQGTGHVRLYGLPEILITGPGEEAPEKEECISGDGSGSPLHDADRLVLINAPATLDFILDEGPFDEYVLLTALDEKSLLRCYAYAKTIHARNVSAGVQVVFGDTDAVSQGDAVFRRLSGFMQVRLGFMPGYLGGFAPDGHFERSLAEQRPLVLLGEASAAKDALTRICSLIIEESSFQERELRP